MTKEERREKREEDCSYHTRMGMIRQGEERAIPREHQIAASEAGLDLDRSAGGSERICW